MHYAFRQSNGFETMLVVLYSFDGFGGVFGPGTIATFMPAALHVETEFTWLAGIDGRKKRRKTVHIVA